MTTIWYLPLEIVKARYTEQLCKYWIPEAIKFYSSKKGYEFKIIEGENVSIDIKAGTVLDATGRGKYSLTQCANFLREIEMGNVKDGDILYIQDYWTPGLESIFYAAHLYNIKLKIYSMCHAQSVDEFDFTYGMRDWMRFYELGLDKVSTGIFVGSTIHKKQMRKAGFEAPIHVVSLPIGLEEVKNRIKKISKKKEKIVVFTSRLDWEKNPEFMLKVAEEFLEKHKDWQWFVTTSGKILRSNTPEVIQKAFELSIRNPRFVLRQDLSKDEYYEILCKASIQFNCSKQDYVSWTLLEASICDCDICYPYFRSFPECVTKSRMYINENKDDALRILDECINKPKKHRKIARISDFGRMLEAYIIVNGIDKEVNVWKPKQRTELSKVIEYG